MKLSKVILIIAKDDLISSHTLFRKGLYPQSLFFLQQSIEKANKALALDCGIIKPDDLHKEIGHNTYKIYNKYLKKEMETINILSEAINKKPKLKESKIINYLSTMELKKYYDHVLRYNVPSFKPTKRNVLIFINMYKGIRLPKYKVTKYFTKWLKDAFIFSKQESIKILNAIDSPEAREEANRLSMININKISERTYLRIAQTLIAPMNKIPVLVRNILVLYYASLLTDKLAVEPRYPVKMSKVPRLVYGRNHNLVLFYNQVFKIVRNTLYEMDSFIK